MPAASAAGGEGGEYHDVLHMRDAIARRYEMRSQVLTCSVAGLLSSDLTGPAIAVAESEGMTARRGTPAVTVSGRAFSDQSVQIMWEAVPFDSNGQYRRCAAEKPYIERCNELEGQSGLDVWGEIRFPAARLCASGPHQLGGLRADNHRDIMAELRGSLGPGIAWPGNVGPAWCHPSDRE